ncbi:MAG: 4-carboxymuconolactone decarboxylase [Planctomycetes bacterium]|nr:4-carboxymuconolactone decarboxylase [Planctomycetota bacterium]
MYGDDADEVRALLAAADPLFAAWVGEHAYGRVLSRPGLSADRRELLAVCALAALGQGRQLASHARGALRCGAAAAEVSAALDCVADLLAPAELERARAVVARFTT